jgi:flagellar hook protein FlgE
MEINAASMMAHQTMMNYSSHNVANVNTQPFSAKETTIGENLQVSASDTNQPTQLSKELPQMSMITAGFDAQAKAIHSQDHVLGTLLNLKA